MRDSKTERDKVGESEKETGRELERGKERDSERA